MQFDSYIVSDTKTAFSVPIFDKTNIEKNKKSFKRFAFTLAETLITLTIIGVVAALTIPNLLNKYTKHTYVVGLKKAYSQLQHAMKMIPITEGCSAGDYECAGMFQDWGKVTNIDRQDFGGDPNKKNAYLLSKQFKVQKLCLNGECNFNNMGNNVGFITEDGTFYSNSGWASYVDINGKKGPNKIGRDIFIFQFANETKNGIYQGTLMPYGSKLLASYNNNNEYWKNSKYCQPKNHSWDDSSGYCTGRVLEEDAMKY